MCIRDRHQTAWSVSALSDWMVVSGELEPDYAYALQVNLQPRASGSFTPDDATASETVTVPLSELVQDDTNFFFGEGGDTFSETFTVALDTDGVFTGELVLPDDMPLGTYSFNLTGDFWLSSRIFTVAEYRAPEFQVTVTPEQPEALRGTATEVTVEAAYLFGGSAAGLPVNWNIFESEYIPTPESAPGYAFGDQAQFIYELSLIHI